ncbi:MAG: 50S ribosomal protein L2, partial [Patescibacteria group bacterium]
MALKLYKPVTAGLRFSSTLDYSDLHSKRPEKRLIRILKKNSGRNSSGVVTTRHQGGRQKRFLRTIDWKRDKKDVIGKVVAFEYDPNRTANLALIQYSDGDRRYILSVEGMKIGQVVV